MLTSKLEAVQTRIRDRSYPHFSWLVNDKTPWVDCTKPLTDSTFALITTCGVYCVDSQLPFDVWNDLGDPSFREIHLDTSADMFAIAHTHYDHKQVAADINVVLPVAHFRRLVEEKVIRRLHPWAYGFMGYLPEPHQLINKTGPQVARRLAAEGVDAAFLTPC